MKIKPLIQLREMISKALSGQTNLSKSFQSFFIETMELILTHTGRLNFTQLARCGRSCESRFRQNFKKSFDWLSFNRSFLESTKGHRIAIAIDPCYISKSGKKTPGIDWFWSGCASAINLQDHSSRRILLEREFCVRSEVSGLQSHKSLP